MLPGLLASAPPTQAQRCLLTASPFVGCQWRSSARRTSIGTWRGVLIFLASFLRSAQERLDARLQALYQFVNLMRPESLAAHVALQILRTNLLPRFTHIFRFVPLRLTLPWARDLDRDLVTWLESLLHPPLRDPPTTWALLTPPSRSGLGFTPLVIEVLLHCLSGLLALTAAGDHPMTRDETADAQLARESLHDLVAVDALTCAAHLLPRCRPAFLRQVVQDGVQRRMLELAPWLTAPPLDAAAVRAGLTPAFQYRVCLAWLTAPGRHLLSGPVLRHAIATHLHLPLCGEGARCCYRDQAHAGPCNAPLDLHAHHVHACGQGPRQTKHDRLCDAWQHLLREGG